jgi:hypothetical protein
MEIAEEPAIRRLILILECLIRVSSSGGNAAQLLQHEE